MAVDNIKIIKDKLRVMERILGWEVGDETECCGLTVSQRAVLVDVGAKGSTSLVDLAQGLGLDASTLSRTINGLVNIGLVRRETKAEDRRYVTLSLTKQGTDTLRRIDDITDRYFEGLMTLIPADRHQRIVDSLCLLADALETKRGGESSCPASCPSGKKTNDKIKERLHGRKR